MEIKWIGGSCGHWEIIVNGKFVASCDEGELTQTLKEIEKED